MTAPRPDRSSIGSAYFRAMHVRVDAPPHVFEDTLGLALADSEGTLTPPPGMTPEVMARLRASIVARARFIEDLVAARADAGVRQYVLLGAGLDTFAERRQELASRLQVFEVDRPEPQAWKRQRLVELGYGVPAWLHLVPVDFEAGGSWRDELERAGYDAGAPAVVASTGVSMYLTREAVEAMLRQAAALAPGSTFVMSFALPDPAQAAPLTSLFAPDEVLAMAREAGFREVRHVPSTELAQRYFSGREDGLSPAGMQDLLVAEV